jgi:nitrate reductase gamma subunit
MVSKVTGVFLFVMGVILIGCGFYLHFAIPLILAKLYLLNNNQQQMMDILSGTAGSLLVGGIIAFGITDIVVAIGMIKKKKWAVKALIMLIIAGVSLNVLTLAGMPNYTSLYIMIVGALIDGSMLLYFWRKGNIRLGLSKRSELLNNN